MTHAEQAAEVQRLRTLGLSRKEIAARIGKSRSLVNNLLWDPDGTKQREIRRRHQGVCENCGAATDGSNGRAKAPRFCATCAPKAHRTWTQENVIAAIRRFATEHGRPPHANDWNGPRSSGYPSLATVQNRFGSWANAIEAAGFTRPRPGHYDRRKKVAA